MNYFPDITFKKIYISLSLSTNQKKVRRIANTSTFTNSEA